MDITQRLSLARTCKVIIGSAKASEETIARQREAKGDR
jgi:hypothetical protein